MRPHRHLRGRLLLLLACLLAGMGGAPAAATAAADPATRIAWRNASWFASGANIPWRNWRCDFGCRGNGGVTGEREALDRHFGQLERRGVKVVRWYLFPGDAWQVKRGAGDAPAGLQSVRVYQDMDAAVALARQHDLYLVFVLFSDTRTIPATWFTNPVQREALADSLWPMFSRYGSSPNVLAWELFNEPERGIDAVAVPVADVQATVQRLASSVHARGDSLVTVGAQSVDRLPLWKDLGLDFFSAHWFTPMASGPSCARCVDRSTVAATYGLNRPIVIGAVDAPTFAAGLNRYRWFYNHGYAGTWAWSLYAREHPSNPTERASFSQQASWYFMYDPDKPDIGPRARVLNPCLGPRAPQRLFCPDLRMSPPSNLFTRRTRRGRTLLLSRNSINSMGSGAAELYGRRSGPLTMNAVQRIKFRAQRGKLVVRTGANLHFKAVPGQYRYWKWRNAATFELWQLDGVGNPRRLMRRGPKTTYCLRDLRRTHGWLVRSPRTQVYPGCNQSLATRRVMLGTSVGWSDIYPSTYNENWIDVTDLRGCYAYVHIADPTNVMYESNERNNRSWVTVRLPYTGSNSGCPNARLAATSAGTGGSY